MSDAELAALEALLGRPATEAEQEAEIERLLAVAEAASVQAYLEEVVAVGRRHGFGLDAISVRFTVDRRSADGFAWGDERILSATLDTASPYPSEVERAEAERRIEALLMLGDNGDPSDHGRG